MKHIHPSYSALSALTLTLCLVLAPEAQAAFTYDYLWTDENGDFGDSRTGWSGPASQVVANAGKPNGVQAVVSDDIILEDATSGVLSLGPTRAFVGQNGFNANVLGTMSIDVGSGTFDMNMDGTWSNNSSLKFGPNNFGIYGMQNVTTLVVEFTYSEPVASDVNNPPTNNSPFLGAIQAFSSGSSNYDLGIEYIDLVSSTDGVNFTPGVPTGAEGINMNDLSNSTLDSLVPFDATTGGGSATNVALVKNAWHGWNAIDIDPSDAMEDGVQNNGSFEEAELVYASGIRFTISRTDGAFFDANEQFIFSGNGNQWNDTENAAASPIPEPSSALLLGLAGLSLFTRKRD